MKGRLGAIILFTFLIFKVSAQNQSLNPTLDRVIPPSPNVSALSKFGNIPVGQSTGVPQVNVPIYAYDSKVTGLQLSISLDYHAGGIRVDEMSSNVGIGWSLNAGGVISRTVRGLYDEMSGIGFINSPNLPSNELEGNSPYTVAERPFNKIYNQEKDGQNDLFNFNFNGRTGKFVLGKNNNYLMINQQKLKVEKVVSQLDGGMPAYPLISKFTITDENGYKYVFEDAEITHDQSTGTAAAVYTSAWYLSEIITPSGKDKIDFIYENTIVIYTQGRNASEVIPYPGNISYLPTRPYSTSFSAVTIKGKRLSKIVFPTGAIVEFAYSSTEQTETSSGDYLLKKITIKDEFNQRGFNLQHDYSLNRPTLKKVIPFAGISELQDDPYEFTYDIPLPDRLSNQQDHWGFYNSNQGSLIPSEIIQVDGSGTYGQYESLSGGNRDADPVRCKAGSLKEIKYPTGGHTVFIMEPNTAVDPRLNQEWSVVTKKYSAENNITVEAHSDNVQGTVTDFTFNGDPNSQTNITFTVPAHTSCSGGNCKIVLELRNASNLLLDVFQLNAPSSVSSTNFSFTKSYFVPGTYHITAYTQGLTNYHGYLNFKWVEVRIQNPVEVTTTIGHNQLYVGGLRLKKLEDYSDNLLTPALVKEYEYELEDGTSSGTLGVYPVYTSLVFYDSRINAVQYPNEQEIYAGVDPNSHNFLLRSSSTVIPLAYANGNPVAYKRVVEKTVASGGYSGKTVRYFNTFLDAPVMVDKPFPYVPPEYKDWCNSLLDSVLIYDENDNLLKEEKFEYSYIIDDYWQDTAVLESFRSVTIAPVKYLYQPDDPLVNDEIVIPYWVYPVYFKSNNFYPTAGRAELVKKTTYEYSGSNKLKNEITYLYDSDNYYLKTVSTKNSKGESIVTTYKYPKDIVSSGQDPEGIYQNMISKNIVNTEVEVKVEKNDQMLYQTKKKYVNPFPAVFEPGFISIQNRSNPIETRIKYEYDESGKVINSSKSSDLNTSYIWAYKKQFPIAEAKNAFSNEIFSNSFEEGGWDVNMEYDKTFAHTGNYSGKIVKTTSGEKYSMGNSWITVIPGKIKKFHYSGWVYSNGPSADIFLFMKRTGETGYFSYTNLVSTTATGKWTLIEKDFDVPADVTQLNIRLDNNGGGTVWFDDIRLHPSDAQMTTYTYAALNGMSSQTDINNRVTYYEYDGFGRLKLIRDQDKNIIKQFDYQYQVQGTP